MLSTSNISFRVALSNDIPAALGVADAGVGTEGSKSDHVHAAPNSTDITDSTATGQSLITAVDATAARSSLGLGTAALLDTGNGAGNVALRSYAETLTATLADTSLSMLEPVTSVLEFTDLATGVLAPMAYDNGAKTLTAGVNMDISGFLPLNTPVLIRFTTSDMRATGIYTVTDVGADDPGGSTAVFTRRADLDATADFVSGLAVLVTDEVYLFRLTVPGGFVMGEAPGVGDVTFSRIGPGSIVELGLIDVLDTGLVGNPDAGTTMVATGGGAIQRTSADVSAMLAAANAAAARAAVLLPEERRVIPLCGYVTNAGPLTAHGRVRIDPADYVVAGRTLVATLETLAEVSVGGLSAEITLVDVTHASAVVATVTETATATTRQSPGATLHTDAAVYELQSVLTGVGYVGFAANLILTWSTP